MVADVLGWPALTHVRELTVEGGAVTGRRETDDGVTVLTAELPVVVSVSEKINEPRYPSFKGIMAAKKKPVATLTLADVGVDAGEVGLAQRVDHGDLGVAEAAQERGGEGHRRGRRRRQDRRRSWSARSSSETEERRMAEVLVLVDHVEGEIKKATYELLTAARALGEPSAVVVGPAVSGQGAGRARRGEGVRGGDRPATTSSPRRSTCWPR